MANPHRGEIEAELDGRRFTLCLTLGALAELEGALGERDLLALAERFEKGRIASRDAIRIIGAGLRGAGSQISDEEVVSGVRDAIKQFQQQNPGIEFWGHSFVCGPQGEWLARAGTGPEILLADVDLARSEQVRRIWPYLRDRRIDAYAGLEKRLLD